MKTLLLYIFLFISYCSFSQKIEKPKTCGWFLKDSIGISKFYNEYLQNAQIKKGEKIASVGAQAGNLEVLMSLYTDSVDWTLEDIDTSCLNESNFNTTLKYYEQISGKLINSKFKITIGTISKTYLPTNNYDRVLLINTYHEMSEKKLMLADIYTALKPKGLLVISERMANRRGKKRHDCHHKMPYEPDLLEELNNLKFKLISKNTAVVKSGEIFYIFEKN